MDDHNNVSRNNVHNVVGYDSGVNGKLSIRQQCVLSVGCIQNLYEEPKAYNDAHRFSRSDSIAVEMKSLKVLFIMLMLSKK